MHDRVKHILRNFIHLKNIGAKINISLKPILHYARFEDYWQHEQHNTSTKPLEVGKVERDISFLIWQHDCIVNITSLLHFTVDVNIEH